MQRISAICTTVLAIETMYQSGQSFSELYTLLLLRLIYLAYSSQIIDKQT